MPSFLISWKFFENKPRAVVFIIVFVGGGGGGGFFFNKKAVTSRSKYTNTYQEKPHNVFDLFNSIPQWSHYCVLLSELDLILILAFFSNIKKSEFWT